MVKRKASAESAVETDSKRLKGSRSQRAKSAELPQAGIQDFQTEKPRAKPRVRGERIVAQRGRPDPAAGKKSKKPSRGRGKVGTCPVKEEAENRSLVVSSTGSEAEEDSSLEESEVDWEDVEELQHEAAEEPSALSLPELQLPEKALQIEIETPLHAKERESRERREAEFESYLRRMINRFTRQLHEDIHKTHLLCLLANGIFRNRTCSEPKLRAVALSLLPAELAGLSAGCVDLSYISKLLKWFVSAFEMDLSAGRTDSEKLSGALQHKLFRRSAGSEEELVHLFLIVLRALPLSSRLVISLQPIPFKQSAKVNQTGEKSKDDSQEAAEVESDTKPGTAAGKEAQKKADVKPEDNGKIRVKREGGAARRRKAAVDRPDKSGFEGDEHLGKLKLKSERRRRVASKVSYREPDTDQDDGSDSDFEPAGGSGCSSSSSGGDRASVPRDKRGRGRLRGRSTEADEEEDSGNTSSKRRSSGCRRSAGEVKSSDQWIEVYADIERKWVAVDCVRNSVDHPALCAKRASKPVCYIVSFDNEGSVRDVTQRYDPAWMTATRKRRVDPAWWEQTLSPYRSAHAEREAEEERELRVKLLEQPLPTSIIEYKNHPLYVLQRHLLKYETLYPPTASILGYCKKEAVYSRDCVHVLHSKDTWLKEARVVRDGEVPCKVVKSQSNRARRARMSGLENRGHDDLGLFGRWQTEDYHPPRATGGKVPRNEFGNVYLFRPCMLPLGCQHVRVPNLHRVARKLDIDCASAVTGFDFHSGHSHPIIDGYVVCEEHVEVLLTACKQEEVEQAKREQLKREKRVVGNWKLLVKGLLIRERLKSRYQPQEGAVVNSRQGPTVCSEDEGPSESTLATDAASSWPLNRQEGGRSQKGRKLKRGEEKHLFPFEKL